MIYINGAKRLVRACALITFLHYIVQSGQYKDKLVMAVIPQKIETSII